MDIHLPCNWSAQVLLRLLTFTFPTRFTLLHTPGPGKSCQSVSRKSDCRLPVNECQTQTTLLAFQRFSKWWLWWIQSNKYLKTAVICCSRIQSELFQLWVSEWIHSLSDVVALRLFWPEHCWSESVTKMSSSWSRDWLPTILRCGEGGT